MNLDKIKKALRSFGSYTIRVGDKVFPITSDNVETEYPKAMQAAAANETIHYNSDQWAKYQAFKEQQEEMEMQPSQGEGGEQKPAEDSEDSKKSEEKSEQNKQQQQSQVQDPKDSKPQSEKKQSSEQKPQQKEEEQKKKAPEKSQSQGGGKKSDSKEKGKESEGSAGENKPSDGPKRKKKEEEKRATNSSIETWGGDLQRLIDSADVDVNVDADGNIYATEITETGRKSESIKNFFKRIIKELPSSELKKTYEGLDAMKVVKAAIFAPHTIMDQQKVREQYKEGKLVVVIDSHNSYNGNAAPFWEEVAETCKDMKIDMWRSSKLGGDYIPTLKDPKKGYKKKDGRMTQYEFAEYIGASKDTLFMFFGDGCSGGYGEVFNISDLKKFSDKYNHVWMGYYKRGKTCGCNPIKRAESAQWNFVYNVGSASALEQIDAKELVKRITKR